MNRELIAIYLNHGSVTCWDITEAQAAPLYLAFPEYDIRICRTEAEFTAALPDTAIALTWTFRQEWLTLAPNLKQISTPAAGRDYFHIEPPAGLRMLNGQFHGEIMAETAVGCVLAMTRGLLPAVTTYSELQWPRTELDQFMRPIRNSTVLIAGFGHIGQQIGRLLKPFGAKIIGLRRNLAAERPEWMDNGDSVITEASLENILPQVDHLIMVMPGDTGTTNFFNRQRLELLPARATVTNFGRGNALDCDCLMEMLKQKKLTGACLDVFAQEPLPADSPLRNCPNLWIFPHSSAISPNYLDLYIADFIRQNNRG